MALRNAAGSAPAATAIADPKPVTTGSPAFEAEDAGIPSAAIKVEATTALAATGSRAVSTTVGGKFQAVLKELEGAIPADQAEALKRVKSGAGVVKDADNYVYGRYIDLTLVSFHTQYVASPGSDTDEAKEHVRYSYDGKTTTNGEGLNDYVEALKAQGYPNASIKTYTVLVGILDGSEKGGGLEGDLVQVSLSPQSKTSFDNYRMQTGVKQIRGLIPADKDVAAIRIEAESKSKGTRDFTLLKVVGKL